jgi:hypothetical protein
MTLAALIPPQLDTSTNVLCDRAAPASLLDSTIDGFDLVPSLFRHDLWQIGGSKGLLGGDTREISRRGKWGRRTRRRGI